MKYTIVVKNNDKNCGIETFSLLDSCPEGFLCSFDDSKLVLRSGESEKISFILNPINPKSTTSTDHSFSITVENDIDNEYSSATTDSYRTFNNLVQPIIFFTKNYSVDNQLVDFFESKIFEIRKFYFDNNNNKTFQSLPLSIVEGDNLNEFYWCHNAGKCELNHQFEGNIINELQTKGYPVHPDWNQFPGNRAVWVLAIGGGGYAGGRSYPTGGGFSMVGDAAIYGTLDNSCERVKDKYFLTNTHPNAIDYCQNTWLPSGKIYGYAVGALAHELGHSFQLGHPDSYGYVDGSVQWSQTVLGEHWHYPNVGLLDEDRNILATNKFFVN